MRLKVLVQAQAMFFGYLNEVLSALLQQTALTEGALDLGPVDQAGEANERVAHVDLLV